MRSFMSAAVLAAIALGVSACSGGYGSPPTAPGGSTTPPAGAVVINVVGENGALSFSPNPATVPAGQMVSWHNVDNQVHRVVLNDGELDTGNIGPGAFSPAMSLVAVGPYHCTIHPSMVGTLVSRQQ
jgi:plastocyanin